MLIVPPFDPLLQAARVLERDIRVLDSTARQLVVPAVPRPAHVLDQLVVVRRELVVVGRVAYLSLVRLAMRDASAFETLVRAYFPVRYLYGGRLRQRWRDLVEPGVRVYALRLGLSLDEAWRELVRSALGVALAECRDASSAQHQLAVAKRVRQLVEAELGVGRPAEYALEAELVAEPDIETALAIADLEQALAQLDERDRTVVLMKLAGWPTAAIAEQLGLSANAVDQRWSRARRKLASWLA